MTKRASANRPNDPTILILTSLAAEPKHGYALQQDIEGFAGVRLGPGTLYGAIGRLEDRGLIEAIGAESRRRPYRITAAGLEVMREAIDGMERIVSTGSERLKLVPSALSAGGAA
jgi:DNA-binding PadR family transcriptional regulator